jgi:hypothetical protein
MAKKAFLVVGGAGCMDSLMASEVVKQGTNVDNYIFSLRLTEIHRAYLN